MLIIVQSYYIINTSIYLLLNIHICAVLQCMLNNKFNSVVYFCIVKPRVNLVPLRVECPVFIFLMPKYLCGNLTLLGLFATSILKSNLNVTSLK